MIEKLKEFFSKYLDLIFRVGLMITIISVWDSLTRVKTYCYVVPYGEPSDSSLNCTLLKGAEEIFRDFIGDLFPLVVFLSVFYVVFWFFKKDK
tara:strand:+ start:10 stop:288 length:279 start_codon:yes stop_codon:yes gene_type:complete